MNGNYSVKHSVLLNRNFKCEVFDGVTRRLKGYLGLCHMLASYRDANTLIDIAVNKQKTSVKRYFRNGLVITLRAC